MLKLNPKYLFVKQVNFYGVEVPKLIGQSTSYFLLLCLFVILGTNACGKSENSKRRDSLTGFENSVPLGEIDVEEIKPTPSITVNKKIETVLQPTPSASQGTNQNLNSQKELLGVEKEIVPPSISEIQKTLNQNNDVPIKRETVGSLQKLISLKSKIISITGDDNGQVFIAERYDVIRIENEKISKVIDSVIYQKLFNESMPAIATITSSEIHGLWIGFTNGEIINFHKDKWTKKVGGPAQKRYAIKKIIEISKRIFIIGKGFYEWESKFDRFLSSDDLRNEIITDIAKLDDENIIISTQNSIRTISLLTRNMNTLYNSFTGDFPIKSILVQDEKILVGGNQGILILSKSGFPLGRFASSIQIEELKSFDNTSGTILDTDSQIYLYKQQNVQKINSSNKLLAQIKVSTLQSFINLKMLYVGAIDGTVYSGSSDDMLTWAQNNPTEEEPFRKDYVNACAAAEDLIGQKYYSRQISTAKIDDKRFVFFNGEQVCPNSAGFMRADGYTAILRENEEAELFQYNKRESIKLPEQVSSREISKMFIDSEDQLYLGTHQGLYMSTGDKWTRPDRNELGGNELLDDPITDIIEDFRGNIWLSTRIKASDKNQSPPENYNALHLRTKNNRWADFGKKNGLNTLGISSLVENEGILYIGSALGYYTLSPDSKIHSFSKRQGLKNFILENINVDSKKRIWMSHGFFQSGLSWIEGNSYYQSTKSKGLFSDSIINIAEDDNNRIWVMDTSGLVAVYSIDKLKEISSVSKFDQNRAFVNVFSP